MIKKIDNSDGSRVQVMISDINSYKFAMDYMIYFNDKNKMLLFWDEPTISLDMVESPLHQSISKMWKSNHIPM